VRGLVPLFQRPVNQEEPLPEALAGLTSDFAQDKFSCKRLIAGVVKYRPTQNHLLYRNDGSIKVWTKAAIMASKATDWRS
jgi:hypothetical protein